MPLLEQKLLWGEAEGGTDIRGECGKGEVATWDEAPVNVYQCISHHLPLVNTPHCVIFPVFLRRETNS